MDDEKPVPLTNDAIDFMVYMPTGNDLVLIVLKGHLLLEQKLERIIEASVIDEDLFEKVRFTFEQKWALAKSMCWRQHQSPMWAFIKDLNTLRNDLAHTLGTAKTEQKLNQVLQSHKATLDQKQTAKLDSANVADRLKHSIIHTLGFLSNYWGEAMMFRHAIERVRAVALDAKP